MILLKTIKDEDIFLDKDKDIFPDLSDDEKVPSRHREAARAVVFDAENKVALLHVKKHSYHKLPGGGLEEGEDIQTALEREMMEEIGCKVEVQNEIGEIIEHRNQHDLMQISHIYLAKLKGNKGKPNFTDGEIADGFEVKWLTLTEAINALENDKTDDYQGKFIKIRDLTALISIK